MSDPYSTHLPVLDWAIKKTSGSVLEIGCGNSSTVFLHNECKNRRLVTIETNEVWFQRFVNLRTENHELFLKSSYDDFRDIIMGESWDVVLVDHAPALRRNVEINILHHCKYVVVHDFQDPCYMYNLSIPKYKYIYVYDTLFPNTAILSDFEKIDRIEKL